MKTFLRTRGGAAVDLTCQWTTPTVNEVDTKEMCKQTTIVQRGWNLIILDLSDPFFPVLRTRFFGQNQVDDLV